MRQLQYELHGYANGTAVEAEILVHKGDKTSAKGAAGRFAKRIAGPVDIAHVGNEDWADRYVTTANPSKHHASGYRFERLD